MRIWSICLILLCASIFAAGDAFGQAAPARGLARGVREFKAGQVWSYKTRKGEEASRLIVVKVDKDAKWGKIVHVALTNLKIKRPWGGFLDNAQHLPFSEKAVEGSVVKLISEDAKLPDFQKGYDTWREAFDAGRALFWATSVAEAVGAMEETVNVN